MGLVGFVHRSSKPTSPKAGTFYWVSLSNKTQIWFAPDSNQSHLILLNDELGNSILTRLSNVEGDITEIQGTLTTIAERLTGVEGNVSEISSRLSTLQTELSDVAKTGSYNDLTDKPTLFSGDYNDLNNKPDIPEVPQNVSSFTNDAGYLTEHQDISGKADKNELPSKVSDLTNDAGYLTEGDLPDYLTDSDLDERGYLTEDDLEEYAKKEDIPTDVELDDSDYDMITERLLTWKVI